MMRLVEKSRPAVRLTREVVMQRVTSSSTAEDVADAELA